jgi:3-oxoadipate enol-lactonase
MPFTHNQGVRLHWWEQGQGSPVLLIMGRRYSGAMWYPLLPALAARHRVICFDNRGTGDSAATWKVSIEQLAGDALAVLDAAGAERAHVHGVSLGGGIALALAVRQPRRLRSLIVGCSGIWSAEKPRLPGYLWPLHYVPAWLLRKLGILPGGDSGYGSAADPVAVAFDRRVAASDPCSYRGVAAQGVAIGNYCIAREAVAGLTMPSLVLHGDEDTLVPHKYGVELAEVLPNSRLVTLQGAGHNYIVAAGPKANAALLDFLAEVDAVDTAW